MEFVFTTWRIFVFDLDNLKYCCNDTRVHETNLNMFIGWSYFFDHSVEKVHHLSDIFHLDHHLLLQSAQLQEGFLLKLQHWLREAADLQAVLQLVHIVVDDGQTAGQTIKRALANIENFYCIGSKAKSVYKLRCPCVCLSICLSVYFCGYVCEK